MNYTYPQEIKSLLRRKKSYETGYIHMAQQVLLNINNLSIKAELNDSESAKNLLDKLPLRLSLSRWGDEYYGDCGIRVKRTPVSI
jgi:hypothetical protein